ncbi:hypothetical protein L226DRAFT_575131 [Lentinus tigrinus ALCF2SS1-7]|uniref:Ubiquitin 3 binding protein But2 C-terminal domain-containing protein n=1 Tax=Lentinus tigrinus ALCF2SS1-6 TaxID=1328759 RepID=A0A5C2RUC1_9APHY|nr:hypothetical protein L227DRAFT_616068 [Lentinus tigrinus ALCF2SS1-6]RPD70038.1 hypothetical protein L226DRAFT_575131 [Lentinus tigrinus ALCF2SS1-7]
MAHFDVEYEELLTNRDSLDSDDVEPLSPRGERTKKQFRWWTRFRKWGRSKKPTRADHAPSSSAEKQRIPPLLLWLAAAVVLVACTDLFALAYIAHMFGTVFQDKDFASHLEYANPYIGLKELYESGKVKSSDISPILIRPRVSAQVFIDQPNKFTPRGEHDYWDETWGMLSPNERHLHVTPNIHTIVQFRAIDFGMEDCRLVFTFPKLGVPLEEHASFSMDPSSRFHVFRLAVDRPIDVKKLSYRTKPKAAEKIATLQAQVDGDTLIHRFPCPWSSLHVFEVACAEGSECMVDVWSSQNTTYGVNMYQYQTI